MPRAGSPAPRAGTRDLGTASSRTPCARAAIETWCCTRAQRVHRPVGVLRHVADDRAAQPAQDALAGAEHRGAASTRTSPVACRPAAAAGRAWPVSSVDLPLPDSPTTRDALARLAWRDRRPRTRARAVRVDSTSQAAHLRGTAAHTWMPPFVHPLAGRRRRAATTSSTAADGASSSHGASSTKSWPSRSIRPRSGPGCCAPRPRKPRAAMRRAARSRHPGTPPRAARAVTCGSDVRHEHPARAGPGDARRLHEPARAQLGRVPLGAGARTTTTPRTRERSPGCAAPVPRAPMIADRHDDRRDAERERA